MSHFANTRAFSRRMGRGFWSRAKRFSESAKPATGTGLASDGTTGADSGSISANSGQKGGDNESIQNQQRPSPPSTHSAGGGVCCVMLCQVHYDRWATLAVIAIFIGAFAVSAIRSNRSSRPTSQHNTNQTQDTK